MISLERRSWIPFALLAGALSLGACKEQPAPRSAYEGEPLRAAIEAGCGPGLRTTDGKDLPCVQVDVYAEGEGEAAVEGDYLALHYIVLLPDGSELDSSHERNKPLRFRLGRSSEIIEGMHIGMTGARVGELRGFSVPPPLAYRGRKMPGLPPDADLRFLVQLVERRSEL